MNTIENNLHTIDKLSELQQRDLWMNKLHPLTRLLSSVIYIVLVASFDKYDIVHLAIMAVYPFFCFMVGELSLKDGLYRMRVVLPLVLAVGLPNPFFDRQVLIMAGSFAITGGMVSMVVLMIKGLFTVLALYVLIATSSVEDICYALRCLHVPKTIVIVVLLIGRYIYMLGSEASRITTAYRLRAPRQKGIHYKAWGTLVGQWLIRSMDRAQVVYESMCLRGFRGDFPESKRGVRLNDVLYTLVWALVLGALRFTGVVELIGQLFVA